MPEMHNSNDAQVCQDLDEHLSASNKPSALVSMKLSEYLAKLGAASSGSWGIGGKSLGSTVGPVGATYRVELQG